MILFLKYECEFEPVLLCLLQLPQSQRVVESSAMAMNARTASKHCVVQCTKCGRTNAAEARFCDWCGTKVSQ